MLFVFVAYSGVQHAYVLSIGVTWRVSWNRQELLNIHEHLNSSPIFLRGSVLVIFLLLCVVLLCVFTF